MGPLPPLPVDELLGEVVAALRDHPAVVVQAPPGAGKTTRVSPALLDAGLAGVRRVVVLEPRRVAARAACRRIAAERGCQVGEEVGYQVRFDRRFGPSTRLLVVTEGVLVAMLQRDPFLDEVGLVVFDEVHERHLDTDLSLAMVRRVQEQVRPDLRLVAMSATVEADLFARALGGCPRVESPGRLYPVEVEHVPRPAERAVAAGVVAGVRRALASTMGDLLVFLPGMAEIVRCREALAAVAAEGDLELLPLHGDLSPAEQDRALARGQRRRVVLATNLAETSLTLDGVSGVVDSGLVKRLSHDPGCGLDRLELGRVSRSSAEQRAGRAGRQGPGFCVRLWSAAEHAGLIPHDPPEIRRVDLAGLVLQLLAWGEPDPAALPWLEPPPPDRLLAARELLERLGAVDRAGVTATGRRLASLPVHPRLGRLLLEAHRLGCLEHAAMAAALLTERLPAAVAAGGGDLWEVLGELTRRRSEAPPHLGRVRGQLLDLARRAFGPSAPPAGDPRSALARAVLAAFPDRLARRRQPGSGRAVMVGGRGLRLPAAWPNDGRDLLVAVELDAGRRGRHAEAPVRLALPVEREDLPAEGLHRERVVEVDGAGGRVRAVERVLWQDLVLQEHDARVDDDSQSSLALAAAASERLDEALGLGREEVMAFLARLRWLAASRPELGLPVFAPAELAELLPVLCRGRRSLAELGRVDLVAVLRGLLDRTQLAALDREAPERLLLPSGSRVRLRYEPGRAPVLAARIQELFGLAETPRVAGGRVPVMLHMLAPNGRPQQVTDDLAGFWERTYPQVRRELRGRYPKHDWPEDPLTAQPQRGARRRR